MPIFFNFHILLATFYTIFGTNILIQCPVPVPVCCMFYVSQKTNIKRNPNGIKTDGELFWNIWDFPEEESTRNGGQGGQEIGVRPPPGRSWHSPGPPERQLTLFFFRKKANFMRKIWAKDSPQSELRISRYKGNGARAESENAKIERETERQIQSRRGSHPPTPWEPRTRGETLLPSREEVKEEE